MTLRDRSSLFLVLACAACATAGAPAAGAPAVVTRVTRDTHAAYERKMPAASSCAQIGPFGCDVPPSSGEELCTQLAKCLVAHDPSTAGLSVTGCGELSTYESAPPDSGVKRVAVVNVDGRLGSQSGQGSYLVAEREGGFCLVDQAVRWESNEAGYLDTDSRLAWRTDNGRIVLSVRTQAVRYDEDDDDEGTSMRGALCRDAEYALEGGRFTTARDRAVNEPCEDEE